MSSEYSVRRGRRRFLAVSIAFSLAAVLMICVAASAWFTRSSLTEALLSLRETADIAAELKELKAIVVDAESGERAYLITGNEDYLSTYQEAILNKRELLETLGEKLAVYPEIHAKVPELLALIGQRDAELEEAIEVRRTSDLSTTIEVVRSNIAKQLTGQIRHHIDNISTQIDLRTIEAEQEFSRELNRSTLIMNLGAAAALLTGIAGLAIMSRQLQSDMEVRMLTLEKEAAERSDKEKSKFLASMNHEIRTPLNAMLGFSELLGAEVISEKGKRYLRAVRESGESLAELINDILDLSKIESGNLELDPEPVSLRDYGKTFSLLFTEQARSRGLDMDVVVEEDCPSVVLIDGLRLRQVLVNLISNALKFTQIGQVELRIRATERDGDRCTLVLEVKDTGRGIPEEKQELIFQPFRQAETADEHKGGTGLGLSISRELVMLMGGEISVESEVEKGSTFRVTLHSVLLSDHQPSPEMKETTARDFNLLAPTEILIVDDNPLNRALIAGFMDDTHHRVRYAENGLEALHEMERSLPDIVLMDIRMPVMTGKEARERMIQREHLKTVPTIAVTASSLLRQEQMLRRSFDGYLRKPFTGAQLFNAMEKFIPRMDPGDEASEPLVVPKPAPTDTRRIPNDAPLLRPETLVSALQRVRDERLENLRNSMVLGEVTSTAEELTLLAGDHQSEVLRRYAEELRLGAESFDQLSVEQALNAFPDMLASIRQAIESES